MKLQYELTNQDFIDFNINFMETSPTMKRSLRMQRFIVPILLLASPATLSELLGVSFQLLMAVFGALAIVWVLFYLKWFKLRIAQKSNKLIASGKVPGFVGPHELIIEQGVISDKTSASITRYEQIEKVNETPTHIFVYVSEVMAYIIPKSAFVSTEELEAFKGVLVSFGI